MNSYADYRYRFPLAGLALSAGAFTALRAAGLVATAPAESAAVLGVWA